MASFCEGTVVRLKDLKSSTVLNGAEGIIIGGPEDNPPRYPIRLLKPHAAVAAHPGGVRVKPENLEPATTGAAGAAGAEELSRGPAASAPAGPSAGTFHTFNLGATARGGAGDRAPSASAAAAGRGGSAGARPAGGPGPSLTPQMRLAAAGKCVEDFREALDADLYPYEALERIFGVQMGDNRGMDLCTWPMGNLVYGAWITIRNWHSRDKFDEYMREVPSGGGKEFDRVAEAVEARVRQEFIDEVTAALLAGRLPQWYERQLRELEEKGRASAYVVEIIRRNFRGIPWDNNMLSRLAGQS